MKKSLGKSINFFTSLSYENYVDPVMNDPESNLGEENAEIYYEFVNLKEGKRESGVAFHNVPYFPASIPAVKDALNVDEFGEGDYAINRALSYDDCLQAFNSLLDRGVPMVDITVDTIKNELQQGYRKVA